MNNLISPNFDGTKLNNPTQDDLIDIFEDRMKGWFLDPTRKLLSSFNDLPASMCLQMMYFESIWSSMTGKNSDGNSLEFFRKGFVSVFHGYGPQDELLSRVSEILYKDARCGFFHDGMLRDRIFFGNRGLALEITLPKRNGIVDASGEINSIIIDPKHFIVAIERHFADYVKLLRVVGNVEQRALFEQEFVRRQGRQRVIGIPDA